MRSGQLKRKAEKGKTKNRTWLGGLIVSLILLVVLFFQFTSGLIVNTESDSLAKVQAGNDEPEFRKEGELVFYSHQGLTIKSVAVEIADNEYERAMGLMFRKSMADSEGMLFIMERFELQSFWMKDTYIPLDILFLDEEFRIVTIQRDTKPLSLQSIPSYQKAKYVIEVNAGFCERYSIQTGDCIQYTRM